MSVTVTNDEVIITHPTTKDKTVLKVGLNKVLYVKKISLHDAQILRKLGFVIIFK